jgi:AcrR family transcriptional regulator
LRNQRFRLYTWPKENETTIFVNEDGLTVKSAKTRVVPRPAGRPRSEQARRDILEAAYKLLKAKGFQAVGSHEIAKAASVSSATLYRWWNSREEIMLDACFEHMKPVLAVSGGGSALARLRRYVLYVAEFLASEDGVVMARLFTGIHDDTRLRRMFFERYVKPRRQMQRGFIGEAIAAGQLKRGTDTELLIDALNGPLFFRWLQGHAPLEKSFAEGLFDKVISVFQPE